MRNRELIHLVNNRVASRHLLALVRGPVPTADLHQEIRAELVRHLDTTRTVYDSWQAAWNSMTGAQPRLAGVLTVTPVRCRDCHGKKFMPDRRLGQYGACRTCNATGRGKPVTLNALHAPEPEPTDSDAQED